MTDEPTLRRLPQLFEDFPYEILTPVPSIPVRGLVANSRQVQPEDVFIAMTGGTTDGHRYIPDAIHRGAAAVIGTQPLTGLPVPYVQVTDSRQALPHLAAAYYGWPARRMTVIGITGTDGKTTTSNLIFSIMKEAGLRTGMISTVSALIGDEVVDTGFHVTTPDPLDVQRYLSQMAAAGMTHAILETTSHGLEQHRVDACEFDLAVVTNITHEHLDFHGSYTNYRAAKGRLFQMLGLTRPKAFPAPRVAVLNRDDASYEYLLSVTPVYSISYGFSPQAAVRAEDVYHSPHGQRFTAVGSDFRIPVESRLFGNFNVSNCLAALTATAVALGIDPAHVQAGLAAFEGVPGRMQYIEMGQPFTAVVDFAHTPNALKAALETARTLAASQPGEGRVIAVFGSAGLRDRAKRRMMAETSAQLADLTILTAEDPRTESLDEILAEMAAGAVSQGGVEGQTFWRVPDRGEALRLAVSMARPGDVVMACGKGHEQSMCFGDVEFAWDDRTALRAALADHLSVPGPQMPYLPTQDKPE